MTFHGPVQAKAGQRHTDVGVLKFQSRDKCLHRELREADFLVDVWQNLALLYIFSLACLKFWSELFHVE